MSYQSGATGAFSSAAGARVTSSLGSKGEEIRLSLEKAGDDFEATLAAHGGRVVSVMTETGETVAQKIAWAVRTLGLSRFQLKYAVGGLAPEIRMESIRLYGTEVIPRVRELLAEV